MDELTALSSITLKDLPSGVRVPHYDRSVLSAGIVHIGLGNFHRAHQAWYLHRLMDAGLCHDWAIIGAGVRTNDAQQRERLIAQDCLTTLIELDPSGMSAEISGSMIDFLPVEEGNQALIERMAQPDIRIVSLTVTEGGYYIDPSSGGFDASHPDIVYDSQNPTHPKTAFGAMVAALKLRREKELGPFTGLSCDNLQGNGTILKRAVVGLAGMSDPDLATWIEAQCTFPNSMVDCIVPATGPKELELVHSFGIDDKAPVTHENFRQWVIEDDFCAGRPDWDKVGATLSGDVHEYEAMKLRILNGGHQMIAVPADLLGIDTISGAMAHDGIRAMLQKIIKQEVAPNVKSVPNMAPLDYLQLIERRFSNPEIVDTTRRVAFDGSSRQTGFIVPSIRDALAGGQPIDGLALMSALWACYCLAQREDGSAIAPNDPYWDELQIVAHTAQSNPIAWLEMRKYYGDLSENAVFSSAFAYWYEVLARDGVEAALSAYNSDKVPAV
ncbi:mannitol dehydrogenase family protein [Ahrensia kielensis]|uniref:mannitol dehydrogenase family protein n=1 Tax=Ahrensia kielensis TaxID=76980 RepID=UPI0003774728|nr:mannitol dehydrogenase family protein [Ahrensia kielensis]